MIAQCDRRDPSHSEIEFQIKRAGLTAGDPVLQGMVVGKAKRVRAVLSWARNATNNAEVFVAGSSLISGAVAGSVRVTKLCRG